MFFNSLVIGTAFAWSLVITLVLTGVAYMFAGYTGYREQKNSRSKAAKVTAFLAFPLTYITLHLVMWAGMPAFTGIFWGASPMLIVAAIVGLIIALVHGMALEEEKSPWVIGLGSVGLIALLIVVYGVTYASVSWGENSTKQLSDVAVVTTASKEDKLPETDATHMVMVDQSIAYYLGQQSIAKTGDNLGSIFHTVQSDYTLQSVRGHLYWVAPLEYNSMLNQLGWFGNAAVPNSPGYIVVDAEDPNADVKVVKDHPIHYMPTAVFSQNLLRHIYLSGYTGGSLEDPTLEVDDDWKPYYTVAYTYPKFTVRGDVVRKVLVVDAFSGEIKEYDQDKLPAWVDRVMSKDLVSQYVDVWGTWGDERSRKEWPNFGGQFMMTPNDFELLYNKADRPVWLVTVTSKNSTDMSCTGVMLYDANKNEGKFYPGLAGIGIGENVQNAFEHTQKNIRGYKIGSMQLYSINGEPTWVAIYVQSAGNFGNSFAAIGFLDARHVQGANVIMESDKQTALTEYMTYLANAGNGAAGLSQQRNEDRTISGTIERIGQITVDGQTQFVIKLYGNPHLYTAGPKVSNQLPIARENDRVTMTYLDLKLDAEPLKSFSITGPTQIEQK